VITAEISQRARQLAEGRDAFVTATVVRTQPPTSVHAGDVALVLADGSIEGFVGGVCTEHSLRAYALKALESGAPIMLRILPFDEHSVTAGEEDAGGMVTVQNPCLSGGAIELFLEPVLPSRATRRSQRRWSDWAGPLASTWSASTATTSTPILPTWRWSSPPTAATSCRRYAAASNPASRTSGWSRVPGAAPGCSRSCGPTECRTSCSIGSTSRPASTSARARPPR